MEDKRLVKIARDKSPIGRRSIDQGRNGATR